MVETRRGKRTSEDEAQDEHGAEEQQQAPRVTRQQGRAQRHGGADGPSDSEEPQHEPHQPHANGTVASSDDDDGSGDSDGEAEAAAAVAAGAPRAAGAALEPLDCFEAAPGVAEALAALEGCASDPASFLQPDAGISRAARQAAKALLHYTADAARRASAEGADGLGADADGDADVGASGAAAAEQLGELHVGDGFDAEQVWLQLDMQLAPLLQQLKKTMGRLMGSYQAAAGAGASRGGGGGGEDSEDEEEGGEGAGGERPRRRRRRRGAGAAAAISLVPPNVERDIDELLADYEGGGGGGDSGSGSGSGDLGDGHAAGGGLSDEEEEEEDEEEEGGERKRAKVVGGGGGAGRAERKRMPFEDRFMNLDDMEAFLDQAEREAAGEGGDEEEGGEEGPESSEEDRGGAGAGGSDLEDDDDEEMRTLLASSAQLVGKSQQQQQKQGKRRGGGRAGGLLAAAAGIDDDDEDDDEEDGGDGDLEMAGADEGATAMYADFFGDDGGSPPPERPRRGGGSGKGEEVETDKEGASDEEEEEDSENAGFDEEEDEGFEGMESGEEEEDEQAGGSGRGRGAEQRRKGKRRGPAEDDSDGDGEEGPSGSGEDDEQDEEGRGARLSTHERRLLRMQERVRELEEEAMGAKPWQLAGEVTATRRPINSALEVDMDFETTARPPPAPTEEGTADIEETIKRRIAEHRFDDVVRVVAAPLDQRRTTLELDGSKPQAGLAEEYEKEFVTQATGFTAPDKQEPLRREAKALFKALVARLDALSSFHFTPKPVVEELEVHSDVAAIAMEEVAPLAVSAASMRTAAEAFVPEAKGEAKAEAELSREERKRRRAKRKRQHAAKDKAKEAERAAKAVAQGGDASIAGRKSLSQQLDAAANAGLITRGGGVGGGSSGGKKKGGGKESVVAGPDVKFGRSAAAFGAILAAKEGGKKGKGDGAAGAARKSAAVLKL